MTVTTLERTGAGWYPDPAGQADLRWFDGTTWTAEVNTTAGAQKPQVSAQKVDNDAPGSGWYPDPAGGSLLRFYDGVRWTEKVAPAPTVVPIIPKPQNVSIAHTEPMQNILLSAPRSLADAENELRAPARRSHQLQTPLQDDSLGSSAELELEDEEEAVLGVKAHVLRHAGTIIAVIGALACLYAFWVVAGSNLWGEWSQRNLREEMAASAPAVVVTPSPEADLTTPLEPIAVAAAPEPEPAPAPPVEGEPAAPAPAPAPAPPASAAEVIPVLPADGDILGTIRIPSIGVDEVFVAGTEVSDLKKGPGVWRDGAFPGTPGNATISGHRTTYGSPFRELDKLNVGDQIIISIPGKPEAIYEVRGNDIVKPDHVEVTYHTPGVRLTLTTCDPVGSAADRLVIQAELVQGTFADQALPSEGWTFQK